MRDYSAIADRLADDIDAGRLAPGARLPTQRALAEREQVAVSTVSRAYRELARRGLTSGEVGRGTFVRAAGGPRDTPAVEDVAARVDLEQNYSVHPDHAALLAPVVTAATAADDLDAALRPNGPRASAATRAALVDHVARADWRPDPRGLVVTGNGRQAVAAALSAVASAGDRVGVEPMTYPVVTGIARLLGLELVPLEVDAEGVTPESVRAVHGRTPLRALYLQPTVQNPLGTTMGPARRRAIAAVLAETDLVAVEDAVYAFLRDELPLAALAADSVLYVDGFSKRLVPGLTAGMLLAPEHLLGVATSAVRGGGWAAGTFALAVVTRALADGVVDELVRRRRADATHRQRLVGELLGGFAVAADPQSYHCWWTLPEGWRPDTFVAAAARHGIGLTPAAAFAATPHHSPRAVRLALASPPTEVLATALATLAEIARGADQDVE